jgi:hypothetical protein
LPLPIHIHTLLLHYIAIEDPAKMQCSIHYFEGFSSTDVATLKRLWKLARGSGEYAETAIRNIFLDNQSLQLTARENGLGSTFTGEALTREGYIKDVEPVLFRPAHASCFILLIPYCRNDLE